MSRRAGHRAVELELRITDWLDEQVGYRRRLPCVPGPRSRRQRYLKPVAARQREFTAIVGLGNRDHSCASAPWRGERECGCGRDKQQQQMRSANTHRLTKLCAPDTVG